MLRLDGLLLIDPHEPPEPGSLVIEGGRIIEVRLGNMAPPSGAEIKAGRAMPAAPGRIICPGFIDAHMHLPQIDCVGCDGMELFEWLDRVVYPAERWWGSGAATQLCRLAVRRMLTQGTLGFAGYLTSHAEASGEALRLLAGGFGAGVRLRFAAGRVAMDRAAPDDLTAEDRARSAMRPSPSVALPTPDKSVNDARCEVSINPRFAVGCTEELLAEVGWCAREWAAAGRPPIIQTHLGETASEQARVRTLFPDDPHETGVYDRLGVLTSRTLLAHCVHLEASEWELIRRREAVAVHCPTANLFLGAGLFDLDAAREHGIRLALGSDVAAGPDVAMPRVARAMIETARARRMTIAPGAWSPSPADVWEIITRGNADALGWSDTARLEVGAWADLLVLAAPLAWLDEHLIGRLVYNWSPGLIERRIVAGEFVETDTI